MNSADQVVFVLQLTLALGPLAVYFLLLGLVNSQAHSRMINARIDFLLLTVAFVPVIIAPVVFLVRQGWLPAALGVVLVVAGLFRAMLPARSGTWVIYNIDSDQCRRLLEQACVRLGWSGSWTGDQLHISPAGLRVSQDALPWLRNVTLRVAPLPGGAAEMSHHKLINALQVEIEQVGMLPSPAGASLVLIGAGLLGMPLWYVFHHFEAIVDVVRQILFA